MDDYSKIPIEELIEVYRDLADFKIVAAYISIGDELTDRAQNVYSRKPEMVLYKEVFGYEFMIELPYDELLVGFTDASIKHHDYSYNYKKPDGSVCHACLSLCGYSRNDIVERIEAEIDKIKREVVTNG